MLSVKDKQSQWLEKKNRQSSAQCDRVSFFFLLEELSSVTS